MTEQAGEPSHRDRVPLRHGSSLYLLSPRGDVQSSAMRIEFLRSTAPPAMENLVETHAPVCQRCHTFSAFDPWLGTQGLFDAIEMSATMHRTPQDARLPTRLDLRHHLR
jgi:hypothetical protein